jgi:thioredoxin reductase (NADPH)
VLVIAGGLGSFEPRKPTLSNLEKYEGNGVQYSIQDPEIYRGKKVVIAGGGDSALDWTIILADIAAEVTLIHRSNEFRGALSSVEKVQSLKDKKRIKVITSSQVEKLEGESRLESISIKTSGEKSQKILVDYFIPLFGLLPKLGPISEWGLEIEKNAIKVNNSLDYQTNIKGVFAVGDVNTYPGKLKLILCGFHEATVMCQYAYRIINPEKKFLLKYTTVTGVSGFDGTTKSTPKTLVKKIL